MNHRPENIEADIVALLIAYSFLTVYFPVKLNEMSLFLVLWVTVPTFLLYGLFVEVVVMQVTLLGLLLKSPDKHANLFRFLFNSLTFFILSVVGAMVFHLAGGTIGSTVFWPLLGAVFCYQSVHTGLDALSRKLYIQATGTKPFFFVKSAALNYGKILGLVPLSLTFYILVQMIGAGAFLLLGLPYFFLTYMSRVHNNTKKINEALELAGKIGHEMAEYSEKDKAIDHFLPKVTAMFGAEHAYLFKHQADWSELIRSYEKNGFTELDRLPFFFGKELADEASTTKEPIIYSKKEEWMKVSEYGMREDVQSVLVVPIFRGDETLAMLVLGSTRRHAFQKYQLQILELLVSYFTVSIEKAEDVQEVVAKSERCALTNLYNYQYLENYLNAEMVRVWSGESGQLSVIMIDIDYFKKINDSYGHQSGNDILQMFAGVLRQLNPRKGVVCRYGGEEFVYVVPDLAKKDALAFAETVRAYIEGHAFRIVPDLSIGREPVDVHVTVSMGVATAPEDADEADALLRNADRSLYLWAKRAGRNKVAGYVK